MTATDLPPGASLKPAYSLTLPPSVSGKADPSDQPDCPSAELQRLMPLWALGDMLWGGTPSMRAAGTDALPIEGDEDADEHRYRLDRATLTNYYKNTIRTHAGLPFSSPVNVVDLDARLDYLLTDADGTGRSLTALARDHLESALRRSKSYLLTDVPRMKAETYEDVLARRPRILTIDAKDVLQRTTEIDEQTGEELCTFARIRQTKTERVGMFGERTYECILVLQASRPGAPGYSATYRKDKSGDWQMDGEQQPYSRDWVPLFETVADEEGPPYQELGELNLAHFQSDADQRYCLSFGRLQTTVLTGWREGSIAEEAAGAAGAAPRGGIGTRSVKVGPRRKVRHDNADAKVYLLETNGQPLAAGREDLADLERRMERFGAAQLASQMGGVTATSRKLDDARDRSNLLAWVTRVEHTLLEAIKACYEWIKATPMDSLAVQIPRDFDPSVNDPQQLPILLQLRAAREISRRTLWDLLKDRNTLPVGFDPAAEEERLAEEGSQQAEAEMAALATLMEQQRQQPPAQDQPQDGQDPAQGDSPPTAAEATVGAA